MTSVHRRWARGGRFRPGPDLAWVQVRRAPSARAENPKRFFLSTRTRASASRTKRKGEAVRVTLHRSVYKGRPLFADLDVVPRMFLSSATMTHTTQAPEETAPRPRPPATSSPTWCAGTWTPRSSARTRRTGPPCVTRGRASRATRTTRAARRRRSPRSPSASGT